MQNTKLIYPKLSYEIVGILYKVYNELGAGYQEKYYQKAVRLELGKQKIKFKEQLRVDLKYNGQKLGRYFLDFLIEDKIVLEIKSQIKFYKRDIKQVVGYLKSTDIELGILASFSKNGVLIKRILRGY